MDQKILEDMYAEVESEFQRKTYPEGFPALPDLPAARYFDPDFYRLEMEHVFHKTWLCVGHASQLPKAGAFRLFEQFDKSIILSRGNDDTIRAFRNTCRHRGAALVTEPEGVAKRFICPYHAWGFSLEGELKSVPEAHNFACLDKAEKPLFQIRCETWHGFIFINFDQQAAPLADFLGPLNTQIDDFPIDDMVVKRVLDVEIDCNWKTAYDNFLEIYHVNTVHAKTLSPYLESKSFTVSLFEGGHARFVTRKRGGQSFFSAGHDEATPDDFTTRFKDHVFALPCFPNSFTALDPVGFNWQTFWPKGPNKMVMSNMFMGWKRDDEEDRAFWETMLQNQKTVLAEDIGLFPTIQRSYREGDIRDVMLSVQEQFLYWYNEEIDRRIGAENLPAGMAIPQILGPHIRT
ncbi:Phenylpropionate dioxygenase-like ring-hydroxylating dioxygenase large terminal subunit [Novosphingobium lubricantis]|jgi:phenylpropionate dioxygenase-like ring-hydroxylating dioxygenase large terminal subunit